MVRVKSRIVIAIALTLALILSASASAKYGRGLPGRANLASVSGTRSSDTSGPSTPGATAHSDGFDWGDAAIGAAGALVVTAVIAGGVVTATRTRRQGRQRSVQSPA